MLTWCILNQHSEFTFLSTLQEWIVCKWSSTLKILFLMWPLLVTLLLLWWNTMTGQLLREGWSGLRFRRVSSPPPSWESGSHGRQAWRLQQQAASSHSQGLPPREGVVPQQGPGGTLSLLRDHHLLGPSVQMPETMENISYSNCYTLIVSSSLTKNLKLSLSHGVFFPPHPPPVPNWCFNYCFCVFHVSLSWF